MSCKVWLELQSVTWIAKFDLNCKVWLELQSLTWIANFDGYIIIVSHLTCSWYPGLSWEHHCSSQRTQVTFVEQFPHAALLSETSVTLGISYKVCSTFNTTLCKWIFCYSVLLCLCHNSQSLQQKQIQLYTFGKRNLNYLSTYR